MKKAACKLTLLAMIFSLGILGCEHKEKEPLALSMWHVYGAETNSPFNMLIDNFNDTVGKEKGIKIDVKLVSSNKKLHETIISSSSKNPGAAYLPDMFIAYPKTIKAIEDKDIFIDFKKKFTEEELKGFIPEFIDEGMIDERLLVLPVAKSTEVLFVNRTLFDDFASETGRDISSIQTWEGLYDIAAEYSNFYGGRSFIANDDHFGYFETYMTARGEKFIENGKMNFSDSFKKAWDIYADCALEGGMWLKNGYASTPMKTGDAAANLGSSAGVLYFSDKVVDKNNNERDISWEVFPCPYEEGGNKLALIRGGGLCAVKSNPEREKAVMEFVKYFLEPKRNTDICVKMGYAPVTFDATENYLPDRIRLIDDEKYRKVYEAYNEIYSNYDYYIPTTDEKYLAAEEKFERIIKEFLEAGRIRYLFGRETKEEIKNDILAQLTEIFS